MEVKGATFLYALAALLITLAGFSALLLSIRQMAGARLSLLDRFVVRTILIHLFILTGGALLPPILGLWNVSETWLWRVAALCFAIPMLVLLLTYSHRRRKAVGTGLPPVGFAVFIVVGSAAIAAMLIYIIGGFEYQAAAYITALTTNFFTTAFGFVTALDVIMQQPVGASAPEQHQYQYKREVCCWPLADARSRRGKAILFVALHESAYGTDIGLCAAHVHL